MSARWLAATLLAVAACAPDAKHVQWTVGFVTPALEAESAHVTAWIVRGGCAGTERVYETSVAETSDDRRSEPLRAGVYGFGATATSGVCAPIAEGCVELRVPEDMGAPVALTLTEMRGSALCAPAVCSAGVCGAPQVPDDASMMPDTSVNDCPEGVRRPGGHCYRYYDLTTDFTDARELCALSSADVTVLDDAAEEAWVTSTLMPGGDYWLGITDAATEGTWLTSSGASPTYFHWDPADSAESDTANCARYYIANGMWRDLPCSDEFRVICERP